MGLSFGVFEVGWQLVEQDQQRLALEQFDPGRLPWRRERGVVVFEGLFLAQLLGNSSPDAQRGIALPSGKRHHADLSQLFVAS